MPQNLLQRLTLFASRHYRGVFIAFTLLVVLSALAASRIRFDTDMLNLLPGDDPKVQLFRQTLNRFGTFDNLLVGIRIPEGAVLEPYQDFADQLAEELRSVPDVRAVDHRIDAPQRLLRELFPAAVLYLDDAGRERLAAKLDDEGIHQRVQEMRRQLSTPQGMALKELLKIDPFGLAELLLGQVESSRGSMQVDWTSGYYLSRDRRLLLLLVKPEQPPQEVQRNRALVAAIEAKVAAVQGRWGDIFGPEPPAPPQVVLGGAHLTTVDDARFIRGDAIRNAITSVLGVLVLFLVAFRRRGALVYAFLPLFCGLVLTFGFARLAVGDLSQATSGVAALLIGLGIDFVIVSYGRFIEERRAGADLQAALVQMSGSSGRAVVVGAVTTTATFGAFLATDFPGLREVGLLTGAGILLCMTSVLLLLPAMLTWNEEHHQRRRTAPNLYLHSFGTDRLIGLCLRRPRATLASGAVVTVVAAVLLGHLGFEPSMATMRPEGNRGWAGAKEVAEHFGSGFDYSMLVISGNRPEDVLDLCEKATTGARRLVQEGVLSGFQAATSILPAPSRQRAALAWLENEREHLDPARIRATFERELTAAGLRPEPFAEGLDLLLQALARSQPLTVDELSRSDLARPLLESLLQPTADGRWLGIVRLYQADNRWRSAPPPQAVALAEELGPEVGLTGTNVVNQEVKVLVLRDAYKAGVIGTLLVAVLIWLDFRRLRETLLALTPLAVGILWMLGAMALIELPMNFMNIFVTTMIIGIGVDYGLHMIHRFRESEADGSRLEPSLKETGKAILAAALSTVVGFGSMSLSHYPALRTTGYVAILGALATALVAITLLPAYLRLTRTPGAQPETPEEP